MMRGVFLRRPARNGQWRSACMQIQRTHELQVELVRELLNLQVRPSIEFADSQVGSELRVF